MDNYKISNKYTFISRDGESVAELRKKILDSESSGFLFPKWTHYCRKIEVSLISSVLSKTDKILEIGSGDGYVAYILDKENGIKVTATDMKPRFPQYYDVEIIDGQSTEINEKEYDSIISVHVLEHIEDIDKALSEFSRLLKDDGVMYHLVPSRSTMILTVLMQPLAYLRGGWLYLNGYYYRKNFPFKNRNIIRFFYKFMKALHPKNFFWGDGHGVYNRADCLKLWSTDEWRNKFKRNNFEVVNVYTTDVSYSMHKIFPFRFMALRRYLAKKGFSSANLFVLKKNNNA